MAEYVPLVISRVAESQAKGDARGHPVKTRFDDCIYCGHRAGSGEHTLLAALGGRRTNKSILCRACDGGFAELDRKLIDQLAPIRGLIGVRPDHRSAPVPTQVETNDGVLVLDAAGRPSWQAPRMRSETKLADGSTLVIVECADERQMQEWRAMMRQQGIDARCVDRHAGERFLEQPVHFSWTFGGEEAFREVARIALNFVADQFPHVARLPALRPIKQWIRGEQQREPDEPPYAWFNDGSVSLPQSASEFAHRVALQLDASNGELLGVVSFFDTFEYVVAFGPIGVDQDALVVIDLDPLAETPPGDRVIVSPETDPFVHLVRPQSTETTEAQRGYLRARFIALVGRIEDRQARILLEPLLAPLNATQQLPPLERRDAIHGVLDRCRGYILKLARHISNSATRSATRSVERLVADAFEQMLRFDSTADDGLTEMARQSLFLARSALAAELERELRSAPLSFDQLMLLLNGGPGAAIVFRALMQPVLMHLGLRDEQVFGEIDRQTRTGGMS